jgi:hypothetical protein
LFFRFELRVAHLVASLIGTPLSERSVTGEEIDAVFARRDLSKIAREGGDGLRMSTVVTRRNLRDYGELEKTLDFAALNFSVVEVACLHDNSQTISRNGAQMVRG